MKNADPNHHKGVKLQFLCFTPCKSLTKGEVDCSHSQDYMSSSATNDSRILDKAGRLHRNRVKIGH